MELPLVFREAGDRSLRICLRSSDLISRKDAKAQRRYTFFAPLRLCEYPFIIRVSTHSTIPPITQHSFSTRYSHTRFAPLSESLIIKPLKQQMKIVKIITAALIFATGMMSCKKDHENKPNTVTIEGHWEGTYVNDASGNTFYYSFNIKSGGVIEEINSSGQKIGEGTWTLDNNN